MNKLTEMEKKANGKLKLTKVMTVIETKHCK